MQHAIRQTHSAFYLTVLQWQNDNVNNVCFLATLTRQKIFRGRLTTSVDGNNTHSDQFRSYGSHYPQSVKRGTVLMAGT